MTNETLAERRHWYRYFPESSIEFVVVTRVAGLLLLLAMSAMTGAQRPTAIVGISGILWLDYVLTLWWMIQIRTDLSLAADGSDVPSRTTRQQRIRALLPAIVPATAILLMVAPWLRFTPLSVDAVARIRPILNGVLALAVLGGLFLGNAALKRIGVGSTGSRLALLVPVIHWLALHRMMRRAHTELSERLAGPSTQEPESGNEKVLSILADAFWVIGILPWAGVAAFALARGGWPAGALYTIVPLCCTFCTGIYAVLDVAAMEQLQRRFLAAFRRA